MSLIILFEIYFGMWFKVESNQLEFWFNFAKNVKIKLLISKYPFCYNGLIFDCK